MIELDTRVQNLIDRVVGNTFPYSIQQVRKTPFSACWRIEYNSKFYYLKHNPEHFSHEGKLLQLLNQHQCKVPEVIAFDDNFNLCITHSCGEQILRKQFNLENFSKALVEYASIQNKFINKVDPLKKLNLPLTTSKEILDSIIWAKQNENKFNMKIDLTKLNLKAMESNLNFLLSDDNLTIQHQDFHDGNIIVNNGEVFIIDWSETSLGNPLFSAIQAIDKIVAIYKIENSINNLISSYLDNLTYFKFSIEREEYLSMIKKNIKYYYLFTLKKIIELSPYCKWINYKNHITYIFGQI